jgi:hypothetical protein
MSASGTAGQTTQQPASYPTPPPERGPIRRFPSITPAPAYGRQAWESWFQNYYPGYFAKGGAVDVMKLMKKLKNSKQSSSNNGYVLKRALMLTSKKVS